MGLGQEVYLLTSAQINVFVILVLYLFIQTYAVNLLGAVFEVTSRLPLLIWLLLLPV